MPAWLLLWSSIHIMLLRHCRMRNKNTVHTAEEFVRCFVLSSSTPWFISKEHINTSPLTYCDRSSLGLSWRLRCLCMQFSPLGLLIYMSYVWFSVYGMWGGNKNKRINHSFMLAAGFYSNACLYHIAAFSFYTQCLVCSWSSNQVVGFIFFFFCLHFCWTKVI